ncbi:alpha/beta fold hydrolase [Flavobacterium psychrotolerans]|uniref:Alpha/beta hydrolase n=1 Tax=Flavobacterium psychrotolerans TaxID=2169410 RepID=A0A2U1JQ48_9FLAO|nr:alpha/beta fold hydrolase [Flavobacterium psychrotolerans]PWA06958.1 alpha/beta hydrolase [Flavobacterium psychrotolerans]
MLYSKIEGQGKSLLILHGFLGMSDNWKSLGTQYSAGGFQVHMLDLRNHGRSFHAEEFNYDVMAQDILEYCEGHNLESIDIIGHSMGGKVAMLFAVNYPEKVDKLIVADIGPKYYSPHHQEILAGLNAVDFSKKPERNQVDEILKTHISDFGTRQFLMKNLYWKEPTQLAFRFNLDVFNKQMEQIGAALPEGSFFEKPTLFLRGGNSGYIKEEDFNNIKQHFPKVTIKTIPNVGHWLHAENPKAFYEITTDFLEGN